MSETVEHGDVRKGYQEIQLGPKTVEIPSEWEVRKLDKLTKNSGNYGANISAVEYDPELPRYIRITDIGDDGFLKDDDRKSISRDHAEGYFLSAGDLLFARTGATAGKSYLCREENPDAAYAGYLIRFELDESQVDIDFLALYVQSKLYRDWVGRITRHGAQQNINAGEYRSLEVLYPPLPEQRHIAQILSTVDEQIQQTNEMIEKTTELKRGLVQDLVTYGIDHESYREELLGPKIVELPDSWKVKRMVDVAEIVNGSTPKKSNPNYWGGDIYWATPTDVTGTEGVYLSDTEEKITETGLENCSADILQPGAVLMTSRATIGEAVINTVPVTTNQGFKSLVPGEDLRSEYLYYFVRTMADYLTEIGGGSTFPEINKSDAENIRVPVPPITEQKQIVDIITSAEQKRLDEISYKKHLQELKRGLMQDLLTGEVRVDTD